MSETAKHTPDPLQAAASDLLRLARDYRGSIEFSIRRDLKNGDPEGATMKRFTLKYVEGVIAKAEGR